MSGYYDLGPFFWFELLDAGTDAIGKRGLDIYEIKICITVRGIALIISFRAGWRG